MKYATRYIGKDLKDLNRASPISLIGLIEENFEIQNNACDKFKYDFSKQNKLCPKKLRTLLKKLFARKSTIHDVA